MPLATSLVVTLLTAAAMVYLGVRTNMLSLPDLKVRCGACRRLHWRGQVCHCAHLGRD